MVWDASYADSIKSCSTAAHCESLFKKSTSYCKCVLRNVNVCLCVWETAWSIKALYQGVTFTSKLNGRRWCALICEFVTQGYYDIKIKLTAFTKHDRDWQKHGASLQSSGRASGVSGVALQHRPACIQTERGPITRFISAACPGAPVRSGWARCTYTLNHQSNKLTGWVSSRPASPIRSTSHRQDKITVFIEVVWRIWREHRWR